MATISEEHLDQIGEVVNIAAGNASTALSHMIGKQVGMTVPKGFVGEIDEIHKQIGRRNDLVVSVFFQMEGDLHGGMMMIFHENDALTFAELLTNNKRKDVISLEEEDLSALREVGNILLGASTTALGKFLNMTILHSIPDVAVDMLGATIDEVLAEMHVAQGELIMFNVDLSVPDKKIQGNMYFVVGTESTAALLKKTAEKLGN